MPKEACRTILEVTKVRAEHLQEISESEARAEGFGSVAEFRELWDKLNAGRGWPWAANRPVWVIEFRRLEKKELEAALLGLAKKAGVDGGRSCVATS